MLRKQRLSEIAKKEMAIDNNLFKEYFEYSRPSNMQKNLNATKDTEENKTKVNNLKKIADLMMEFKNKSQQIMQKKLKTKITWRKLSNSFLSLITQKKKEVA